MAVSEDDGRDVDNFTIVGGSDTRVVHVILNTPIPKRMFVSGLKKLSFVETVIVNEKDSDYSLTLSLADNAAQEDFSQIEATLQKVFGSYPNVVGAKLWQLLHSKS